MSEGLRSLECVSSVLATFRAGTPAKAAKRLAQAPSTVYRAIERLENDIGAPVFERRPSGWLATEIGERIIRLAEAIESEAAAAELFLLGRNKSFPATLRVSASDGFAEGYLGPVLTEFSLGLNAPTIELIVDNQFANLGSREAHVAIRPDQKPGDGLIGRRAGKLAHALYGAAALFKRDGPPRSIADLARFKVCMLSGALEHHTAAKWWTASLRQHVDIALIANTEMSLAAAIAAGAGVGVLPCFLGDRLAGVRRVTAIPVGAPVDIWIVTNPALGPNPVIRALMRMLVGAMRRDAAQLAGAPAAR
jgi:DNA-binding transcriptional LysR family regulator